MHVKDAMRDSAIAEVAQAWAALAYAYRSSSPELAASVLQSMTRYISWMDIGLVANEK
jgi:exportin-T